MLSVSVGNTEWRYEWPSTVSLPPKLSLTKRHICFSGATNQRLENPCIVFFRTGLWFHRQILFQFKTCTIFDLNALEKRRKLNSFLLLLLILIVCQTAKTKLNYRLKFHKIQSLLKGKIAFLFKSLLFFSCYFTDGKWLSAYRYFDSIHVLVSSKSQKLIQQLGFSFWVPQKSGNHISSNKSMKVSSSSMPWGISQRSHIKEAITPEIFQKSLQVVS